MFLQARKWSQWCLVTLALIKSSDRLFKITLAHKCHVNFFSCENFFLWRNFFRGKSFSCGKTFFNDNIFFVTKIFHDKILFVTTPGHSDSDENEDENEDSEEELIKYCFFNGLEYKDIVRFLCEYHSIISSNSTLQRRLKAYEVRSTTSTLL